MSDLDLTQRLESHARLNEAGDDAEADPDRWGDPALHGPLQRVVALIGAEGATLLRIGLAGVTPLAQYGRCGPLSPDDTESLEELGTAPQPIAGRNGAPHRLEFACERADAGRFAVRLERRGMPFSMAELRQARQAQPWLCDVTSLWWRGRADRLRADGLAAAAALDDVGVVLLDGDGRILDANAIADELLAANEGLRRTGPMLTASQFGDSIKLQTAVHRALSAAREPGAVGQAIVLALRRRGKRPLAVMVAPLPGTAEAGAARALVRIIDPDADADHLIAPVCDLYGLTGAEARLAQQLARGASLREAAARLRIQPDTARAYLKQIFVKTGVNRQPLLVRLLLQSRARAPRGLTLAAC